MLLNILKIAKRLSFIALILLVTPWSTTAKVLPIAQEASAIPTQEMEVQAKPLDQRAVILRDYFAKYDSPLQDYAEDFVDAADTYGVDWKLVPSIAGVESTFGKATPGNYYYPSYNGWGWGVYGTQSLSFKSWKDGIYTVTAGLQKNYISKGITSPYDINYTYASSTAWGGHVAFFMDDLDRFAKAYPNEQSFNLDQAKTEVQTISAQSSQLTSMSSVNSSSNLILAFKPQ